MVNKAYFVIIISLLVGAALTYVGASITVTSLQSQSWPSVQGHILHSNVTVSTVYHPPVGNNPGFYATDYTPNILYTYLIGNQNFNGSNIDLVPVSSSSYSMANDTVSQYPVGSQVIVYYNPSNPSQSVLHKGLDVAGIVFLIIGILGLIVGIVYSLKIRKTQ